MRTKTYEWLILGIVALATAVAGSASASQAPERLVPPEGAHVTRAWIPDDSPALMAWESTEEGRSGLVLFRDGERAGEWHFDEFLVKDVRWLRPGKTLRLGVVTREGISANEVYSLADGALEWIGSTVPQEKRWESVDLSPEGEFWAGARFLEDRVVLGTGPLGEEVGWEWELKPEGNATGAGGIEELNRVAFLETADGGSVLAVLWNGGMWLTDTDGARVTRLTPPGDCSGIRSFTAVEGGLWAQCLRAPGSEPPALWGFYPAVSTPAASRSAVRVTSGLRKPWFRGRSTVLDLDRRRGKLVVHSLSSGTAEPTPLGTVTLPVEGARYTSAGDALLQAVEGSEEYRVIPLGPHLRSLGAAPPGS